MKTQFISISRTSVMILILISNLLITNAAENKKLLSEAISLSDEAYIKFDKSLYIKSQGICERVLSAEPNNKLAQYYMGYNKYRLVNMAMINEDGKQFDLYYDSAIETLEPLVNDKDYSSESRALLAAIYMMKLATDQSDAQALSVKINGYLEQAINLDSENPRNYLIKGTMLFNTPPMFGGSIEGALNNFSEAISIFESISESNNGISWGYLEALAWKGMALSKKEDFANARLVYDKALKIEADFGWVKYRLLPELEGLNNKKETSSIENRATLKVVINGFNSSDGFVLMKLMNSEEQNDGNVESFKSMKKEIIDGKVECQFSELAFGDYTFKCYHDENNNGKLDSNSLGIPTESYGFSNNAIGSFGPPSYADAKFTVDKNDVIIEVNLN